MDIVQAPNPVLATPTKPVTNFDTRLKRLITTMERTLNSQTDPVGVGLAANQVGMPLSLFIAKDSPDAKILICINPKIVKKVIIAENQSTKKRQKSKLEGCLSIKYIWGSVSRSSKVLLEYQDITGKHRKEWFSGFLATIIQHEVDHLFGTLFTQRVLEQKGKLYKEVHGELEEYSI